MKLGFIGSGRMAEAIILGLTSNRALACRPSPTAQAVGRLAKKNIIVSDKDQARLKLISKKYHVKAAADNIEAAREADVIILAVKPQFMGQVLSQIGGSIKANQLVISIAAGITLKNLEKYMPRAKVIRVMPNNPCLIGEGISAICPGKLAGESEIKLTEKIFSSVGETFRIEEKHMNAVTALSGSGPAFIYEVVIALMDGGVEAGLSKELAKKLAEKTIIGSIMTVVTTGKHPEELKAMVTSPGGTTLAGLRVMEEHNFRAILKKAVLRAAARAKEMSEEFEK